MPDTPMSLRHPDTPNAEDATLAQASRSHVAGNRTLQLIAELTRRLRDSRFPWWTPDTLRSTWDATGRMRWFAQRPDIRQRITCALTGLKPRAARGKDPDFQAELIDSVIDDGDVSVEQFENTFEPMELAAYAPVAEIWHEFRKRMPWREDSPPHQELVAWLFDRLLASYSTIDGMTREPILTPYAIRTTIPGRIWHARLPLDIRVAIDELRFDHERTKPGEPFHAVHDLSVATPTIIAANIPLEDLICVFDAAEKAMGLPAATGASATASPSRKAMEPVKAEPAKAEVKAATPAFTRMPEKMPEVAKTEAAGSEAKGQPIPSPAEKMPEKTGIVEKAEAPKADVKPPQPAAAPADKAPDKPADKAPEKPADKAADRFSDRWERMANKVLERVGKENSEEPANKNR